LGNWAMSGTQMALAIVRDGRIVLSNARWHTLNKEKQHWRSLDRERSYPSLTALSREEVRGLSVPVSEERFEGLPGGEVWRLRLGELERALELTRETLERTRRLGRLQEQLEEVDLAVLAADVAQLLRRQDSPIVVHCERAAPVFASVSELMHVVMNLIVNAR